MYVKEYENEAPYKGSLAVSDKLSSGIEPSSPRVVLVFAGVFASSKAAHNEFEGAAVHMSGSSWPPSLDEDKYFASSADDVAADPGM